MLDRMSGKITHIDFGDCFEVAMTREKFPEKIPFRLTRMLINAMEVGGNKLQLVACRTSSFLNGDVEINILSTYRYIHSEHLQRYTF